MIAFNFFCFLFFMSFLTVPVVKNSHMQTGIYFISLKKRPKTHLKVFQCQISTLIKRLEKQLLSKTNASTFLRLSCSNFGLKLCKRPQNYQNCQRNQVLSGLDQVRSKNSFQRQSFTKYFFRPHVKQCPAGSVQFPFFMRSWQENWHQFIIIASFESLKWFSNS